MPKVTVYPKENVQDTVLEKVKQILEGSDKVHAIITASRPPVYLSGRDISQSEVDELKSLPGIELVLHVEK
ncbi:hypothetical protein DTO166G4_8149 [Paecilomyces variotii]|nr:hypothetical protein DTO032I3_3937 [Paecilomyces variotii]KAJ9202304.1 hypothetical protein DTO164E3_3233 [Paecilomyces variotii]KAJ9210221.1 hypothetical protein DTO166G4_8149 [Paecilomyces variotii]KAJ9224820.1 hypothetical protein DTO169C6_2740 [Paecilomyces variotii]KAJ9234681.1 hypothetical protein DTO166G5_5034 [Paecilomyces variotii]